MVSIDTSNVTPAKLSVENFHIVYIFEQQMLSWSLLRELRLVCQMKNLLVDFDRADLPEKLRMAQHGISTLRVQNLKIIKNTLSKKVRFYTAE